MVQAQSGGGGRFKQAWRVAESTKKGETKEGARWRARRSVRSQLSEEGREGTAKAGDGWEVLERPKDSWSWATGGKELE